MRISMKQILEFPSLKLNFEMGCCLLNAEHTVLMYNECEYLLFVISRKLYSNMPFLVPNTNIFFKVKKHI